MSDLRTAHSPIVIDRVERSRGDGDGVRLRLAGHRLTAATESELDALLIVHLHGRRHRFAATGSGHDDPSPGTWEASFTVPDWAMPVEYGQASLWVGDAAVPVPPVGTRIRVTEPAFAGLAPEPADAAAAAGAIGHPVGAEGAAAHAATAAVAHYGTAADPATHTALDAGRAGPLADALIRETLSALHAELEQRSARDAVLDGELERARAELAARTATQADLEATHGELRAELERLVAAVADQQAEFERGLAQEAERSEAELAQLRSRLADAGRELDGVRSELTHARADAERARSEIADARDGADRARSELAQSRGEADRARAELAAAREQEAGLQHTREQLAAVNERLAAALASDRLRAHETASLREQLAAAQIACDAAVAEAGGLRAELSQLGSELAITREQGGAAGGELEAAQQLLEDARALNARLRGSSEV